MLVTKSLFFSLAIVSVLALAPSLRAQTERDETLSVPVVAPSDSGAYHAINQLPESLRRSAPFAREFYEFARHAGTSGTVDNDAYLSAFEEARQDMLRANEGAIGGKNTPQATLGTWLNIGLSATGLAGADSTPSAGITTAIVFDPQDPKIMYAGGSGGGVWKSTDTGADWTELTDNELPNLSVATIAVDPVNTDTLYVGTGYCYNSVPVYNGSGLYQSTDGGASFQRLNVPGGAQNFVKVIVDPSNHNIVLASTYASGPVYRSTNAGATWTSAFSGFAWDIIATPGASGSSVFYLFSGGVYKSVNDGSTWTKLPTTNFPTGIGRAALASPAKAPNKIFALMTDGGGNAAYLYKSTDTGMTWTSIPIPIPGGAGSTIFNPTGSHGQGWYDLDLAVTPNSVLTDTVYVCGTDAAILEGSNWSFYSSYTQSGGGGNGTTHVDHHSFAINPVNSNIVYDGNDGGLWVNYAAGSTDVKSNGGWQIHSLGMVTNRFYHLGIESNLKITWGGAQDQGVWEITQGAAPAPYSPLGDAMQVIVSPINPKHIYAEGPLADIEVATIPTANSNWLPIADSAHAGVTDASGWDNPFKMSPIAHAISGGGSTPASSILYVGRQHIWQTINGGTSWTKLAPSFGSPDGLYYCSAIGLPNWNADMIYAAGGGSAFELSTDFGVSWRARTNPASGYVTSINTSWQDPKFVVVTISGNKEKVMSSEDSGHTWTDRSGSVGAAIPGADTNSACNVMCLAIDSVNPLSTWYAATDFGIYQTNDTGHHWVWMGPGLIPCRDVQLASDKATLKVATYGRGVWEVVLPIIPPDAVEQTTLSATKSNAGTELSWNVENESAGATFYVERSLDGNGFTSIGKKAGVGTSSGTYKYSFSDNTTAPGTYLYQIHEIDANGAQEFSNRVELHDGTNQLYLYQPYPNPFILNGSAASVVTLNFEVPVSDNVHINIYDTKGTLIRTLVNRAMAGGPQSATWDARDNAGNLVAPGAYFYSVQTANSGMASGKIMVAGE